MAKARDFRDQVIGFLQKALHELHQASMYAQGVDNTDVRRLIRTTEALKARIAEELAENLVHEREEARQKAATMQIRRDTAAANRMKLKKK